MTPQIEPLIASILVTTDECGRGGAADGAAREAEGRDKREGVRGGL